MRQRVQQRGFSGVRVADNRNDRHVVALASRAALPPACPQMLKLFFQIANPVAGAAAVNFQFRFARPARADAAGNPRKRVVARAEARQLVFQLREFDLHFSDAAVGALRENIENQLRPVNDFQLCHIADHLVLRGRQVMIEHKHIRADLKTADNQLAQFPLADQEFRIRFRAMLHERVFDD